MKILPPTIPILVLALGENAVAFGPAAVVISRSTPRFGARFSMVAEQDVDTSASDVSIDYDSAARLEYTKWCAKFGKEDTESKFAAFKSNYEALTVANVVAAKKARDAGSDRPGDLQLNEYADMTMEEYDALQSGDVVVEDTPQKGALETAMEASMAQREASSALEEAANALEEEELLLAQKLGMDSIEEMEQALDAMEGIDVDGGAMDTSDVREARVRSAYMDWTKEYGKKIDEARFSTFQSNYLAMEEYAKENGKEMVLNKYADCTEEEYRRITDGTPVPSETKVPKVEVETKVLKQKPTTLEAPKPSTEKDVPIGNNKGDEKKDEAPKSTIPPAAKQTLAKKPSPDKPAAPEKKLTLEEEAIALAKATLESEAAQIAKRRANDEAAAAAELQKAKDAQDKQAQLPNSKPIKLPSFGASTKTAEPEPQKLKVLEGFKNPFTSKASVQKKAPIVSSKRSGPAKILSGSTINPQSASPKSTPKPIVAKNKQSQKSSAPLSTERVANPSSLLDSFFDSKPAVKSPLKSTPKAISAKKPLPPKSLSKKSTPTSTKQANSPSFLDSLFSSKPTAKSQPPPPKAIESTPKAIGVKKPAPPKSLSKKSTPTPTKQANSPSFLDSLFSSKPTAKSPPPPPKVIEKPVQKKKTVTLKSPTKQASPPSFLDSLFSAKPTAKSQSPPPKALTKPVPKKDSVKKVSASIKSRPPSLLGSFFSSKSSLPEKKEKPVAAPKPSLPSRPFARKSPTISLSTPIKEKASLKPKSSKPPSQFSGFFGNSNLSKNTSVDIAEKKAPVSRSTKGSGTFSLFSGGSAAPSKTVAPSRKTLTKSQGTISISQKGREKKTAFNLFGSRSKKTAPTPDAPVSKSKGTRIIAKAQTKKTSGLFSFGGGSKAENIPTISKFRQNRDGSITGIVKNAKGFKDGTSITTSPVKRGAKAGQVVITTSGSKYKIE